MQSIGINKHTTQSDKRKIWIEWKEVNLDPIYIYIILSGFF